MDSQLNNCEKENDEIKSAKKYLEEQKAKDETHYWIFSGIFLAISLLSLFIYTKTMNDELIFTPLLPIIFGIVGVFNSKSLRNRVLSSAFALIGLGILLILITL